MDTRETFLTNFNSRLTEHGFSSEDIKKIEEAFVLEMKDYELTKICTELTTYDYESEQLIKIFQGTLLTEGKSKKTVYGYGRVLDRFRTNTGKKFTEITSMDIRIWLAQRQQEVSLTTCENYRAYLSSFFNFLTIEGIIAENPMAKIKPIKIEDKEKFPFSPTELDALRSSCSTLRERAELEVLLSSGVRVEELSNLNRTDINLTNFEVHVVNGKGGKSRITYIDEVAAHHLKAYLDSRKDDLDCMFVSKYKSRLGRGAIRDDLKRIGKKAGVSNTHPHRCRRTFATTLWHRGMDIRTIQILMGHSNINTTMDYIAKDIEKVKIEYQRFNN